jgi:hypothetical protein
VFGFRRASVYTIVDGAGRVLSTRKFRNDTMTRPSHAMNDPHHRHRHQLKFWVSDREYEQLQSQARRRRQKISAFVRTALGLPTLKPGPVANKQTNRLRPRFR